MKYVDEFRDGRLARIIAANIRREVDPGRRYHLMEFCGGHTHAIARFGIQDLLPDNLNLIHGPVANMVTAVPEIHCLRDPTRGGLGSTLNEIARQSGVGMRIFEADLPLHDQVRAACEFLGLDPLYVANEGKLVAICPAENGERLLEAMRAHPLGANAAIIGEVVEDPHCFVEMETAFGGNRIVDWLTGEQLPRIC